MRSYLIFREGGMEMETAGGFRVRWTPTELEDMLQAIRHGWRITESARYGEVFAPIPDPREAEFE